MSTYEEGSSEDFVPKPPLPGELTDQEQSKLRRENIARCKAYKANPPPAPPQPDYVVKKLATPLPLSLPALSPGRARQQAKFAAKIETKYGRKFDPVRMTSSGPPPIPSLLDGSK